MKIVTNQNRARHTHIIRNLLKTATKVWIFVAYLGSSGMDWVNPPDTLVMRGGTAVIVMGDIRNIRDARREAGPGGTTATP